MALGLGGCAQGAAAPRVASDDPVEAKLLNARSGNTLVRCRPADAALFVDGVERGLASDFDGTGRLLSLSPGAHRVAFRHRGYEPLEVDTAASPGGRQTLDVSLVPLSAASE
ncbi:MAG: carboxypeptidase-like regulatory domain-containing protein [Myxococcales bacterium]